MSFSMSEFLRDFVVGIDVAPKFSFVALLNPDGQLIRKPFHSCWIPVPASKPQTRRRTVK
jgi:hypothetical protein